MQHFGDAHHGHFVIIGNQFDARLGHARAAHAKKLRAGARAQSRGQPRGIHIARASPAEIRICRRAHAARYDSASRDGRR